MPSPFESYTFDDLQTLANELRSDDVDVYIAYTNGDHWQSGKEWKGPPDLDADSRESDLQNKIKPIFVSKNIFGETLGRHINAVIGSEPKWMIATVEPLEDGQEVNGEEKALIAEADNLITLWWDEQGLHDKFQESAKAMLQSSTGPGRFFVLTEDGQWPDVQIEDIAETVNFSIPEYQQAGLIIDDSTQKKAAFHRYEFGKDKEKETRFELTYLDDDKKTIIRILNEKGEVSRTKQGIELNKKLPIFTMSRPALCTPQMRQNQASFNTALTMRLRNVGTSGFPQTDYFNAEPPASFKDDPANPGKQVETQGTHGAGSGVVNYVSGRWVEVEKGKFELADPSVSYRDPVNVETFDKTEYCFYKNILEETGQLYSLIAGDANISGESRIQARADFITSLKKTKTALNRYGRWVLETFLAYAALLQNQPNRYSKLRVDFECRIDAGPVPADEQRLIMDQVKEKFRSLEDGMMLLNIDDPKAMIEAIKNQGEVVAGIKQSGTSTLGANVSEPPMGATSGQESKAIQ